MENNLCILKKNKKIEEEQVRAIIQFEKSIKAAVSKFRHLDDRYRVLIA